MAKNNMFAIDFESARRAVEEANTELIRRHKLLMEALGRFPGELNSEEDALRAKRFALQIKEAAVKLRANRLEDTKPLKELLKTVDSFFKDMESECDKAQQIVMSALSEYAIRESNIHADLDQPIVQESSERPILLDGTTGNILGTYSKSNVSSGAIDLAYFIKSVDRQALDLESLRMHFLERELLSAARRHLKAHGPNNLVGAAYGQKAVLD